MARCIHGRYWVGASNACPQCFPGRSTGDPSFVMGVDVPNHGILSHVEQWAAIGKLLGHTWDTGPKPDCLVEDVRQLIEESAKARELGRREGLRQALDLARGLIHLLEPEQ
jgi:hypothetical protein